MSKRESEDKAKQIKQANDSAWEDKETPKWASPGYEKPKFQRGDCSQYFNKGNCADFKNCGFNHERSLHPGGKGKGKKGKSKREPTPQGERSESQGSRREKGKGKGKDDDRSQSRSRQGKGDKKGKGKGKNDTPRPCKTCGKTNHKTADCKQNRPKCEQHYKSGCKTVGCQKWHPPVCSFWERNACIKTAKDCVFLFRKSNWTKPKSASPAPNAPYEKARPDSPGPPKYIKAQKKEYKAAQKAEAEKAAAKKEKAAAKKAKKGKVGAVAVLGQADGMSPLDG